MTDVEAADVKKELAAFKREWHEKHAEMEQKRRFWRNALMGAFGVLALPLIGWIWFVTTGAQQSHAVSEIVPELQEASRANTQSIANMEMVYRSRNSHEARIAVLENAYGEIRSSLRDILSELRSRPE